MGLIVPSCLCTFPVVLPYQSKLGLHSHVRDHFGMTILAGDRAWFVHEALGRDDLAQGKQVVVRFDRAVILAT